VKNELALDDEAAEGVDLVGEHLCVFAEGKEGKKSKEASCEVITEMNFWNRAIYRHKELFQFFSQ
jgi:hypothetical protein